MLDPSITNPERGQLASAVHVWQICPNHVDERMLAGNCLKWLSSGERQRHERLKDTSMRHQHLVARALVRTMLSAYTGVSPSDWMFTQGENGKPSIASPDEFSSMRFNLTRTNGLIACATTCAGEVGLDAEQMSRAIDFDEITKHFFSEMERSFLASIDSGEERRAAFFELWVLKEAFLKGTGAGFSVSPESITIAPTEAGARVPSVEGFQLTLFRPTPGYVAAIAVKPDHAIDDVPVHWREIKTLPL